MEEIKIGKGVGVITRSIPLRIFVWPTAYGQAVAGVSSIISWYVSALTWKAEGS